jgi:PBSX family phage terminase large subunit
MTTNPDSPFHWLKTEYIDRAKELGLKRFQFKIEDNPSLTKEFINSLKREYTGLWYKRFIDGEWVLAEGSIYDFFDVTVHCMDYPPRLADYYIVGCDYGTNNPCAFTLVGFSSESYPNVWVEREYYWNSKEKNRQKTDAEYTRDMIEFTKGLNVKAIYIDPSAASFKLELQRQGVKNLYDAENEVIDGIRFVSNFLNEGTLKICNTCPNLKKEFTSYLWDASSVKRGEDKPRKDNDHLLDSLRYAIYTHFYSKPLTRMTREDLDSRWNKHCGFDQSTPFSKAQGWQRF